MGKKESIERFRKASRGAFLPVLERYGFKEEALPKIQYINEYQVRWANDTTMIIVEGINWGMNIDVRLASLDESIMDYETYAFDDLLALRNPGFVQSDGQHAQMAQYANQLAENATDVLSGDFRVFPKLAAAIRRRAAEFNQGH